ncbi:MAG: hypothetical protein AB7O45_07795 [Alphaproteobacteria bacterium]
MTLFDDAIDAIHADENFRTVATYTPPVGAAVPNVTVLLSKPDDLGAGVGTAGFLPSPAVQDATWIAEVRRGQVALPAKGGTLAFDGRTYPVREVRAGEDGLDWILMLGKPA